MPTGACGINCDVCRLNLLGLCTTCGHGKSNEAKIKLATQKRVLGDTCPILSCAGINKIAYCMRDCSQFPCENYTLGPYPFSGAYLDMQRRRRKDWVSRLDPLGRPIDIPDDYWSELAKKDANLIKTVTLAEVDEHHRFVFNFLDLPLRLDPFGRILEELGNEGGYVPVDNPLLTLTVIIYFKTVDRLFSMGKDLISTRDMATQGNYFTGPHELKTSHLLIRFSDDVQGLSRAATSLGGKEVEMGDYGWVFHPFPRLPVYYLFRDLDTDYAPGLSILFDRSICKIFTPPMIWELINLVNARLLSV